MKRKFYRYRVVPLGTSFQAIEQNIASQKEQGWSLISTYMGHNLNTVGQEPTLLGVFETWEKKSS